MHGIYCIANRADDKCYIGSAVNVRQRFHQHRSALRKGIHCNARLQKAWEKHGQAAFTFSVLERVDDPRLLIEREQWWLDTRRTFERDRGYNLSRYAGSQLGFRHSEATKLKMRKPKSQDHKAAMRHPKSPEHRAKVVEALTGRTVSQETREKLRASNLGRKRPMRCGGVAGSGSSASRSPRKARRKLSEALTGRTVSQETREKLRASNLGHSVPMRCGGVAGSGSSASRSPKRPAVSSPRH